MILPIIYCVGFVCSVVTVRAYETWERQSISHPQMLLKARKLRAAQVMNAMYNCRLCDDTELATVKPDGTIVKPRGYTCDTHKRLLAGQVESVVMDDLEADDVELITFKSMIMSLVWPVSLPVVASSFVGKYIGKLLYQKNILSRYNMIKETKETEKYLLAANEDVEKFLKNS